MREIAAVASAARTTSTRRRPSTAAPSARSRRAISAFGTGTPSSDAGARGRKRMRRRHEARAIARRASHDARRDRRRRASRAISAAAASSAGLHLRRIDAALEAIRRLRRAGRAAALVRRTVAGAKNALSSRSDGRRAPSTSDVLRRP